jgi:hypothetical protein
MLEKLQTILIWIGVAIIAVGLAAMYVMCQYNMESKLKDPPCDTIFP